MVAYLEIPLTTAQHYLAIAGIVLFALPFLIRIYHIAKVDRPQGRRALRQYLLDLVLLFCLVRIVGDALYLAANDPTDSVLIGALSLDTLGSSILTAELTKLLMKYLDRPNKSSPQPHHYIRQSIHALRILIIVGIVLFIIAFNISSISAYEGLTRAGALIFFIVFLLAAFLYAYFGINFRQLVGTGALSFYIAALSLPFLFVRMIYMVLGSFAVDQGKFTVIFGDWKVFVGMALVMEWVVVMCLVASGIVEAYHRIV